jgi:hypothetical protein
MAFLLPRQEVDRYRVTRELSRGDERRKYCLDMVDAYATRNYENSSKCR